MIRLALLVIFFPAWAQAQDSDWMVVPSSKTYKETVGDLERAILDKGFIVFDIIDHSINAERSGLNLSPTAVIIFGNPKTGTSLIKCDQRMGIILPLRILIWEEENGKVSAGFIDPEKYMKEFSLENCRETLAKIKVTMKALLTTIEKK